MADSGLFALADPAELAKLPNEVLVPLLGRLPPDVLEQTYEFLRQQPSKHLDIRPFSRDTPQAFIRDVLGETATEKARLYGYTDAWTPDQGTLYEACTKHQNVLVFAGNGGGKTQAAARIALWWLHRRPGSIVVTTAPTLRQVQDLLWAEIRSAFHASKVTLPGRMPSDVSVQIKIADKWYAKGYTATRRSSDQTATAFQGIHAPYVLLLFDEATGIPDDVWEAAKRIAIGPHDLFVALGNPTDPSSHFSRIRDAKRGDGSPIWHQVVINCENHPNVIHDEQIIPGAVSRRFITDRLDETGSKDSALYRSSVLGLFPDQTPDALISMAWVVRAQKRAAEMDEDKEAGRFESNRKGVALGLDVASEGDNLTVLSAVEDGRLALIEMDSKTGWSWHRGRNAIEAVELVEKAVAKLPNVRSLAIDDTGLGNVVTGRLRQLQKTGKLPMFTIIKNDVLRTRQILLLPVNMGGTPINPQRFVNRKDELWWTFREALRTSPEIALPTTEEMQRWGLPRGHNLIAQITTPIYDNAIRGRIAVYDKRDAHARKERTRNLPTTSPDCGHSMILGWDAYRRLTADQRVLPRTQKEVVQQTMRQLAQGPKPVDAGKMPWQVRG